MMEKIRNLDYKNQLQRKAGRSIAKIFTDSDIASEYVASEIAKLIKERAAQNRNCVLGLATGSSPKKLYKELIRLHKEDGLSFRNVITFNLDEYYPMSPNDINSYVYFMHHQLFNHIDIPKDNIQIPNGDIEDADVEAFCQSYEEKIKNAGGLDIQILGIGRTGHIGFNEPGSRINSQTRMVSLNSITINDATGDFGAIERVPRKAITMGVQTILKAKRIFLMAWGEKKAEIIQKTIEGEITESIPATFLQKHENVEFVLSQSAAKKLKKKLRFMNNEIGRDSKYVV